MSNHDKYHDAAEALIARLEAAGQRILNADGSLYRYVNGVWLPGAEDHNVVRTAYYQEAMAHKVAWGDKEAALWKTLRAMTLPSGEAIVMDRVPRLVCTNGTLDLTDNDLYEHDPTDYCTRHVAMAFDPDATCPEWESALDRMLEGHDEVDNVKLLLQEFFGVSLFAKSQLPRNLRQAMLLWGPSETGKSSVAGVLSELFPKDRVTAATVREVTGSFGLATLHGALAWIADEALDANGKAAAGLLKRLFNAEPIVINRKYRDQVTASFTGAVLFTANNPLVIDEDSEATYRRLISLRFTRGFTAEDAKKLGKSGRLVPYLRECGEFPGILNWSLAGARRALDRGRYTHVDAVLADREEMHSRSSAAHAFLVDCTEYDPAIHNASWVVGAAMKVYATAFHDDRRSIQAFTKSLADSVRGVHPMVQVGKLVKTQSGRARSLVGLKLNDEGKRWVAQAKDDGLFGSGRAVNVNERAL